MPGAVRGPSSSDAGASRSVVMASPIGRLELIEAHGALTGIRFDAPADGTAGHERGGSPVLTAAHRQLSEYFEGRRREFDLPLRPAGTL